MNTQMNTRCCSFCRNPGHTINQCQDPRIEETWKYCLRETDLRLGYEMDEDDLFDVETLLRQLPLPFLRVLGVQMGKIYVRSSIDTHITAIKGNIYSEAKYFTCLRWDERIEYLKWLDPDSYDFEAFEQEIDEYESIIDEFEEEIVAFEEEVTEFEAEVNDDSQPIDDLNSAFIQEDDDPNDITHFAYYDRTPMTVEELNTIWDIPDYHPMIEPLILCLETARELSELKECVVCLDEKTAIHFDTTNCGHSFCHDCICHHLDTSKNGPTCPNCRTMICTLEVKDIENYDDIVKRYGKPEEVALDI